MVDASETRERQQLFASDALLLGRVTSEAFEASWPTMVDEEGAYERPEWPIG